MFGFLIKVPPKERAELQRALQDTLSMKRGDPARLVNKAAQYVASFAVAKIPKADPAKMESAFRKLVHAPKASRLSVRNKNGKLKRVNRKAEIQNEWRGTLAAAIVASILAGKESPKIGRRYVKLVRQLQKNKQREATANQFYRVVAKFVRMRKNSTGMHRAGLLPAIKAFRARASDAASLRKNFKAPPGSAKPAVKGSRRVVAKMEDSARAIDELSPNAFRQAEKEVAIQFRKWIREDIAKAAKLEGFTNSTP